MRTGMANLPLHDGKCPPWLFERMKRLGGAILEVIVATFGPEELLREAKIGNSEKLAALKRIATLERKAEVGG